MTSRSPDHAITGSPDLAHSSPSMPDLLAALDEAKHQFLAARDRYIKLRRLVNLRIEEQDRWKKLEQIARQGPLRQNDADADADSDTSANGAEAEADRSRLNQEFNDNVDCL